MSRKRTTLVSLAAVAIFCLAVPALAADEVLGKWEATIENQRGSNEIVLEFTGTADALAGTWTGIRGTDQLKDVTYEEGKLTFTRSFNAQGNEVKINCTATVDGDTMNITLSTARGDRDITATRAE